MFVKPFGSICFVGLVAAVLISCGCGGGRPKTAAVHGKVTYKGQPVPHGSIVFIPDSATVATGEIGPDGSYTLTTFRKGDGAIPGAHKVVITALEDTRGRGIEPGNAPPPLVPRKYMNRLTTDLQAEVKEEDNTIDFDLQDPK
jgi:hypothetical protein